MTEIDKNTFIITLIAEFREMMYDEPKCDYEHHVNITIEDMIQTLETFEDEK